MKKTDVFTRIKCLDKVFTFAEWSEHCKAEREHPEKYTIAAEFHGFKYNHSDVCLNPEIAFEWQGKKGCQVKITLSESPDGWSYGMSVQLGTYGSSHGCPYVESGDRDCYETKDEAYEAAIRSLCESRDWFKRTHCDISTDDEDRGFVAYMKGIDSERQKAIRVIDQLEESVRQPTLFGYF